MPADDWEQNPLWAAVGEIADTQVTAKSLGGKLTNGQDAVLLNVEQWLVSLCDDLGEFGDPDAAAANACGNDGEVADGDIVHARSLPRCGVNHGRVDGTARTMLQAVWRISGQLWPV